MGRTTGRQLVLRLSTRTNGVTGNMDWYFQFTPHDIHDWDAIQVPILGNIMYEGEMRKVMMWANRNAFYYTLDRETGEFLVGKPYALKLGLKGLMKTVVQSVYPIWNHLPKARWYHQRLAEARTGGHLLSVLVPVCFT
ncbi:MAG: hypothetical protein CM1200mP25_3660 [Acidobacteriota bacterium]|nr:MAG: hypothetical protein CM1200mP25_3660 [Acidobacteriota bacterium]